MPQWVDYQHQSLQRKQGIVHLWCASLVCHESHLSIFEATLSDIELASARRFVKKEDRAKYILSKSIQRQILARYLSVKPGAIRYTFGAHGKPALASPSEGLQFNLSHSGDRLLLAVTQTDSIGVDIECERAGKPLMALAKRFFSPTEYACIQSLPPHEHTKAFYRCWTRKESFIKGLGDGFSFPLADFVVDIDEQKAGINCLRQVRGRASEAACWDLQSVDLGDALAVYHGAVAVKGVINQLFCWNWLLSTL